MNFPGYALLTCKISNTMLRITFFSMIMPTEVYVINILTVEVLWDFHMSSIVSSQRAKMIRKISSTILTV